MPLVQSIFLGGVVAMFATFIIALGAAQIYTALPSRTQRTGN